VIEPSSPAHQLVGAVLNNRWKLVRLVGEGGMGAVYEADGIRGEGKRAIKLLHPEFAEEEQILQRFFTEAQAMHSLTHPNIASVQEAARAEDGTPYLVMELLQGASLGGYLGQGTPMSPQQAAPLIYQVLQAISVAHARKIVHRDLKPDNLFLVRDARGVLHAKILDFGIAKVMDAAGGMGTQTRTGALLGTPGYMSPEQIKNSKGVDPRSDLWSVGVILYEMLTCQSPFPADNEFTRLTTVLTTEARPIEQVAPHLAGWGPFFRRALAKDAGQRFQTAEEMAHAVSSMARSPSVAPPPVEHRPSVPVPFQQPLTMQATQPVAIPTAVSSGTARLSYTPPPRGSMAPGGAGPTHVSAQQPPGMMTISSPPPAVQVIDAPHGEAAQTGAPWWMVGVIGFVCLGLGFALGMLVSG